MAISDVKSALTDERLNGYGQQSIQQLHDNRLKLYKELLDKGCLIDLAVGRQELVADMVKTLVSHGEREHVSLNFAMNEFILVPSTGRYPFWILKNNHETAFRFWQLDSSIWI